MVGRKQAGLRCWIRFLLILGPAWDVWDGRGGLSGIDVAIFAIIILHLMVSIYFHNNFILLHFYHGRWTRRSRNVGYGNHPRQTRQLRTWRHADHGIFRWWWSGRSRGSLWQMDGEDIPLNNSSCILQNRDLLKLAATHPSMPVRKRWWQDWRIHSPSSLSSRTPKRCTCPSCHSTR